MRKVIPVIAVKKVVRTLFMHLEGVDARITRREGNRDRIGGKGEQKHVQTSLMDTTY